MEVVVQTQDARLEVWGRDYVRFERLGVEGIGQIAKRLGLPIDRAGQNGGPVATALLELEKRERLGMKLEGYIILPPRADERITIDAILYPIDEGLLESVREAIDIAFKCGAWRAPDEITEEDRYIRLWWD